MATDNEYFKAGVEYKTRDGKNTCVLMHVMDKPGDRAFPVVFLRTDAYGNQAVITRRPNGTTFTDGRACTGDVLYEQEKFIALVKYKGENKIRALAGLFDTYADAEKLSGCGLTPVDLVKVVPVQIPI